MWSNYYSDYYIDSFEKIYIGILWYIIFIFENLLEICDDMNFIVIGNVKEKRNIGFLLVYFYRIFDF